MLAGIWIVWGYGCGRGVGVARGAGGVGDPRGGDGVAPGCGVVVEVALAEGVPVDGVVEGEVLGVGCAPPGMGPPGCGVGAAGTAVGVGDATARLAFPSRVESVCWRVALAGTAG